MIEDAFAGWRRHFKDSPWKIDTDCGLADIWFSFYYSRVLDGGGEVVGQFIFTNETLQRVLADAALKKSQHVLEQALVEVRSLMPPWSSTSRSARRSETACGTYPPICS
ncbi:hypothetical protein ACSFA3_21735 [Variovorax sp. RHLX14]|uniref:hypothetical protein n=1 Tax=Variovorax sp. RHLX14 TaxID=1259731 RepID=UPI003F452F46